MKEQMSHFFFRCFFRKLSTASSVGMNYSRMFQKG